MRCSTPTGMGIFLVSITACSSPQRISCVHSGIWLAQGLPVSLPGFGLLALVEEIAVAPFLGEYRRHRHEARQQRWREGVKEVAVGQDDLPVRGQAKSLSLACV